MKCKSFGDMECPIARAAGEIGDAWTLLVLREAMLGTRLFGAFEQQLGIQGSTLTRKLDELVRKGILARRLYTSQPPRFEYVPTEKGAALLPILLSLAEWGNRWIFGEGAEHIIAADARSGEPVSLQLVDGRSQRAITAGTVHLVPGPAASAGLRRALKKNPRTLGEVAAPVRARASRSDRPASRRLTRALQ